MDFREITARFGKKDIRSSVAYLREKKLSDLTDELLVMKLPHLLSMKKVRLAILIGMDTVGLFGLHIISNLFHVWTKSAVLSIQGEEYRYSLISDILCRGHSAAWIMLMLTGMTVIDIKVMYMIHTNYRDINRNQKGSIRWSELSEIREQYASVPLKYKMPYETYFGKGGVPICQYGTYYDKDGMLCNVNKGEVFIDRSPANNLLLGMTRSGKGETYVYLVIDLYSRAENKEYTLIDDENGWKIYASNIYYDMQEDGVRKTDIPLLLKEKDMAFGKKDFMEVIHNYEKEHDVKLKLPEGAETEEAHSFFDYIEEEQDNVVVLNIPEQVSDKVKTRKMTSGCMEIKVLSRKLRVTDKSKEQPEIKEYEFDPKDAQSKKDALDQAVLYLEMLHSDLENRYEELMSSMGFCMKELSYRIEEPETGINYMGQEELQDVVTDEENVIVNESDVYQSVEDEEQILDEMEPENSIMDGIIEPEKKKEDYMEYLKQTALDNGCKEFHFERNYQASMVVSDPKLELFIASKQILELRGYDVYCLNLIDPYESCNYNPLQLIVDTYRNGDPAEASAIARSLAAGIYEEDKDCGENSFFYENAVFLLAALIMSEVIDQVQADKEANKKYMQEHLEATKRYARLGDKEKEKIQELAKELSDLKRERRKVRDKYKMIQLDRQIEKLDEKLRIYNYDDVPFIPRYENEKKVNLPNILVKFSRLAEKWIPSEIEGAEPECALDLYFQQRDTLDVARNLYSAIKISGGQRTKGSIYSTMLTKLSGFMDEKIKKLTACSSFRLEDIGFGKRPIALFMGIPEYDESNRFILSMFISQLYYALAKRATMSGGRCTREVVYLLDEFGNIPCIKNMSRMLTVCLGRNIRFNLIVQSYSQIDAVYGEEDAKTIHGNCGNQIYIMCNELDTAEKFSNLIGHETIVNVTRMGGEVALTVQKQYTESTEENPLIKPDELMELMEGECVVKRVMMRKDLRNRNVRPRPIFNHGKTAFPLRYQYMSEWFNPQTPWSDLHADSCAGLDLSQYLSDFDKILENIEYRASSEYKEWYQNAVKSYKQNRMYPIGEFIQKKEIGENLVYQIRELAALSKDQLYNLSIADVEKYYIRYESNLPAFRQRMYEISDWRRGTSKTLQDYNPEVLTFFRKALEGTENDVLELYGLREEEKIRSLTTAKAIKVMEEQNVPEYIISQFRTVIENYERK